MKVICQLCHREMTQITRTHLRKYHDDISVNDYKKMFLDAPIFTSEGKKKLSINCKNLNTQENFGFKNGHKINEGKEPFNKGTSKFDNEYVMKYSLSLTGKQFTDEHRQHMSESKREGYKSGKLIRRIGELNSMYGKKLTDEHKRKLFASQKDHRKTRPEILMEKICIQYGFIYTGNRAIFLKFKNGKNKNPDFVIPGGRIAIEVFGDYWHKGENVEELIKQYNEIDWKCLVVWESELKNNKISPEMIENFLGIFDFNEFLLEDFSGKWIN